MPSDEHKRPASGEERGGDERGRAPTSDQLRHALDRGKGADKTDFIDPAAAPLGTDDEASGFPPTAEQRRLAAEAELGRGQEGNTMPRPRRTLAARQRDGVGFGLAVVAAVLVIGLILLA